MAGSEDYDSMDEEGDEEQDYRNFDDEAQLIIAKDTLPKKSSDRYMLVYHAYCKWREENEKFLSKLEENNLIVYFKELISKLKPSTIWSMWSMLRKTLLTHQGVNVSQFLRLKDIVKTNSKGYRSTKSLTLSWENIERFMQEASDYTFLCVKVVLVFGICGCLRVSEIYNIKVSDVEDIGGRYLVTIMENKNNYSGQFLIGSLYYEKVKQYIALRPSGQFSEHFFIRFGSNVCHRQNIGRHKLAEMPKIIATFCEIDNVTRFTGHCFRRTSATLLSMSGATMQAVKQLGRWRSDAVAAGYIENSLLNRSMLYNGVVCQSNQSNGNEQRSLNANNIIQMTAVATTSSNPSPEPSTSSTIKVVSDVNGNQQRSLNANNNIIQMSAIATTSRNPSPEPSTSSTIKIVTDANDYDINWNDFNDNFTMQDSNSTLTDKNQQNSFVTGSCKIIPSPSTQSMNDAVRKFNVLNHSNKQSGISKPNNGVLKNYSNQFHSKQPVQLNFKCQNVPKSYGTKEMVRINMMNQEDQLKSNDQGDIKHLFKRTRIEDDTIEIPEDNNNGSNTDSDMHEVQYNNCTFQNCTFHITK